MAQPNWFTATNSVDTNPQGWRTAPTATNNRGYGTSMLSGLGNRAAAGTQRAMGATGGRSGVRGAINNLKATAQNNAPAAQSQPTYGTGSDGILQNWFNQRASGTDPAYEYTMGRGMDAIDNRMAAGGSFNSGARGQQLSDFGAAAGAHRMGQLDSLAGGASGERQGMINGMIAQMMGLAGGEAGTAGAYDLGSANAMSGANQAVTQLGLNKAGVDSQANQGLINNIMAGASIYKGLGSGTGGK